MISILLPVRDGARTLDAALGSLRAQTYPVAECVVVDDGSTDSTPAVLARWSAGWSALKIARTPGLGIAGALNAGLRLCATPWIARMDADDRCHPRRLERQLEAALARPELALVGCRVRHWVDGDGEAGRVDGMRRHVEWANSIFTHEELERALWIDSPLPHPTWLVHRRAFEAVGAYEESGDVPEDYEWLHRFFATALRARKIAGEELLDWADAATRLTRTAPAYAVAAFDRVKARALSRRIGDAREVFVFGLGPKAKAIFPLLAEAVPGGIRAVVDVHPRRAGIAYRGVEVWSVARWLAHSPSRPPFVLNCVGTEEARQNCERLCAKAGLEPGESFLSL